MDKLSQNSLSDKEEHPPRTTLLLYVDGELVPKEASHVQRHLEACWHCRVETRRIEETIVEITEFDEKILKPYIEPPHGWHRFAGQLGQLVAARGKMSLGSRFLDSRWQLFSHLRQVGDLRLRLRVAASLVTASLIVILVVIFDREPTVSAGELLRRAAEAQASELGELGRTAQPVIYQKLQVRRRDHRRSARDRAISLEIWRDTARSRLRQSVTDESGRRFLPIVTSVGSNSRKESFVPEVLIELESVLRLNHMDPQRPLSSSSYQAWRDSLGPKREEVRRSQLVGGGEALTLRTVAAGRVEVGRIAEAAMVVRARDWHPRELRLQVRAEDGELEYELVEAAFEVVSLPTLSEEVFPPESSRPIAPSPATGSSPVPGTDSAPIPVPSAQAVASAELEVEALRLLNEAGADMGEQVNAKRGPDGLLRVEGIVETDARKAEILRALGSLMNNPAVRVGIKTVAEAVADQRRQGRENSGPPTERKAEVVTGTIPAESDLQSYFNNADEAQRFAARIVSKSQQAMRRLYALKRLTSQFSAEEINRLSSDAGDKWLALIRSHARAYRQEVSELRRELKPIFFASASGESPPDGFQLADMASVARAIERLFELGSANDRVILSAFTTSSESANVTAIKTQRFWQSLQAAEALAARIQAAP
jgi:hypothetical protein